MSESFAVYAGMFSAGLLLLPAVLPCVSFYMERPNLRLPPRELLLLPLVPALALSRRLLPVLVVVPRPVDGLAPFPMLPFFPPDGLVVLPPCELCPQSPGFPGRFGFPVFPGRSLSGFPGLCVLPPPGLFPSLCPGRCPGRPLSCGRPGRPYSGRWGGRVWPPW